ncbi:MAG: hypothetical protein NT122_06550 [Solirubrobacterales bacterium]|nr:hypothetical protein [Solirubrobacterales bacterium]
MSGGNSENSVIAVLAVDSIASTAGAACALRLTRNGPCGLVTLRPLPPEELRVPTPPPTHGAARVAGQIRNAGHPARASWRMVRCDVADPSEAREVAVLLSELCGGVIITIGMPRCEEVDQLLASCSRVLVVASSGPAALASKAAVESLEQLGVEAGAIKLDSAGIGGVLAQSGISAPSTWISAIDRFLVGEEAGSSAASQTQGRRGE